MAGSDNSDLESELHQRFPRAGYWFNMLPTHPLDHLNGTRNVDQFGVTSPAVNPVGPAPLPYPFPYYPPYPPITPAQYQAPDLRPPQRSEFPLHTQLSFSIPLNTGVIGGPVTRIFLRLPTDIPFEDFISRVCARMDLDLANSDTLLGYKLSGDPVRTPPYHLSNEEELREAIQKGVDKVRRSRSREVFIEIHNMVCDIGIWL